MWDHDEKAIDKELSVIYITDSHNNTVHKFNTDGQHLMSTGQKGWDPGKFNCVNGLCVSWDGSSYICDSRNRCIQVFDRDIQFVRCFGSFGADPGHTALAHHVKNYSVCLA